MSTNFPTSLDALTNPTSTDTVDTVSHADQHANANDAIEALEAKVGADGSAVTTSHDYKLSGVTSTDKAVSLNGTETLTNKTLTSPAISQIDNTGTLTLPTSTDTLVGRNTTDTLTNKSIDGDDNTITDIDASSSLKTGTAVPVANGGTGQTAKTAAFDALAPTTTKGDVIVSDGSDNVRMAVGADGTYLKANSAQSEGVEWSTIPGSTLVAKSLTPVTVSNTTTETTLHSVTIPASTLGSADGIYFNIIASAFAVETSKTCTVRLKYGSTTVATAVVDTGANSVSGGSGSIEGYLFGNGTTSSQKGMIKGHFGGNGYSAEGAASGTSAEDSTSALSLVVTVQFNNTGATNAITSTGIVVTPLTS